jgi:hypothetical protein
MYGPYPHFIRKISNGKLPVIPPHNDYWRIILSGKGVELHMAVACQYFPNPLDKPICRPYG